MVFDHTPLTPPPLKHIYGPLIANFFNNFFLQEMEHITLKWIFIEEKNLHCLQICKLEVYGRQWDHQVRPSISTKGRVKKKKNSKSWLLTNSAGPPPLPTELALKYWIFFYPFFFILMDSIHFKTDFSMKKKCIFCLPLPSVTYYLQSQNCTKPTILWGF